MCLTIYAQALVRGRVPARRSQSAAPPLPRATQGQRFALSNSATEPGLFHYLLADIGYGIAEALDELIVRLNVGFSLCFTPEQE